MKVTASGSNLFQLTQWGMVNCYLVREDDGFTLIDVAASGQAPQVLKAAQDLGLPITRIVLTHPHVDHMGSLDALHEALPQVPLAYSARDARVVAGDMSLDPSEPQVPLKVCPVMQTKPTQVLCEGDRVGSLEVIASPGHAVGHIAFLDKRDRSLIAGDAFQTLGGVAVSGTLTFFPLPAFATWDKGEALKSARKLLALRPSLLAIGHGCMLNQPQSAMKKAIQVMERDLVRTVLKARKQQVYGA
jgi:glyoxylase-like metal-dependent hydrolase (beta-lactamase superfamily II)